MGCTSCVSVIKSTFDAICRGRTFSWSCLVILLLTRAGLNRSVVDEFQVFLLTFRSRLWTLFVVFQSTWPFYCLSSMFDFDAICRGRTSFGGHCLPSEVDFERYLSWPDIVCFFMLFFRSRLWTLFVVVRGTFESYCLPSKVDFERYLSWPDALLKLLSFLPMSTLHDICRG